jgi:hypothetical protein
MQAIIRKLEVSSRKDAVIAYLAAGDPRPGGRDNLDFGSPPVEIAGDVAPASPVAGSGDQATARPVVSASRRRDGQADEARSEDIEAVGGRLALQARRFLGSPVRRLVAMAVATLVLGVMTLTAVVLGYDLNRAVDRLFRDPVVHHSDPSGRE